MQPFLNCLFFWLFIPVVSQAYYYSFRDNQNCSVSFDGTQCGEGGAGCLGGTYEASSNSSAVITDGTGNPIKVGNTIKMTTATGSYDPFCGHAISCSHTPYFSGSFELTSSNNSIIDCSSLALDTCVAKANGTSKPQNKTAACGPSDCPNLYCGDCSGNWNEVRPK